MNTNASQHPEGQSIAAGRHAVISHDPASKIHFLETSFAKDRWEATILVPPGTDPQEIAQHVRAKGYQPTLKTDAKGRQIIHFVHQGSHDGLITAVKDAGLMQGSLHFLKHTPTHLTDLIDMAEEGLRYTFADSARLMSGLYLLGDVIQIGNAFGGKVLEDETRIQAALRPENSLNSIAFLMSTAQSVLLINYAKESSDLVKERLRERQNRAFAQKADPMDVAVWENETMRPREEQGLLAHMDQWWKENPITGAASAMIAACGVFVGASAFKLARLSKEEKALHAANTLTEKASELIEGGRKSAWSNIGFSVLSSVAWALFMMDAKKDPNLEPWHKDNNMFNPAHLAKQVRGHPNETAGLLGAAASVSGVYGGLTDNDGDGNRYQIIGQCAYLLGDVMMYLTEKKEYGKKSADDATKIAKAAAEFIASGPLVMGHEECLHYVNQLASYIAKQKDIVEDAEVDKGQLTADIMQELGDCYHPMQRIADKAGALVKQYVPSQQAAARAMVIDALHGMPNIFASRDEIAAAVERAERKPVASAGQFIAEGCHPIPIESMKELIKVIPGQCGPVNALLLHDKASQAFCKEKAGSIAPSLHVHSVAQADRVVPNSAAQLI